MNNEIVNFEIGKFIKNAEEYWVKIHEGDSKAANGKENANRKIVSQWTKAGIVIDILSPLLGHSSSAVRLAAAGYLIKTDAKDQAVSVLRDLQEVEPGLISPSAGAILRINKIT